MARTRSGLEEPPADWTPTQAVPAPIINNPYDEPRKHWVYVAGVPTLNDGRRRATYWFKTKRTGSLQQELLAEEEADDLPLVNRLREDVKRWRNAKYRGASPVTRELLEYWGRADRPRRLFFCQREAVETAIYLLELAIPGRLASSGFKTFELDQENLERLLHGAQPKFEDVDPSFFPRLVDVPGDAGLLPLRRLGCKMATGSGKTVVMAMLTTWAFCNRGRNPATTLFPSGVLICAPNLTVKSRLQVLRPDYPQNYYDAFDLVPAKYRELMNAGRVLVTNWHAFALKSPHREGDATYKVVDKGEEPHDAFTKDRLADLANRLPILVLNDEGHHCWRAKPDDDAKYEGGLTKEERDAIKEEEVEARVWLAGLDRINNSGLIGKGTPGILATIDLSATPFYLSSSGYHEGSPFPWLVSDFGLVDAIESGIVKVPRLPVRDDKGRKDEAGRPDPKYYRLWRHIDDQLRPGDRLTNGRPKPEAVYREAEGALTVLASQWRDRFDLIRNTSAERDPVPPVLIVVCGDTALAEIFYRKLSGEKVIDVETAKGKIVQQTVYGAGLIPEFTNSEGKRHTFRIDTKLLAQIETEESESKDEAAVALRELLSTVGQRGRAGEQVRCVVSVSMLTEGWDATNVTHILGVRAFGSQLLCEQVVGRGLRRMSYTPDPISGFLPAEYVDVYGIPFSLIPFKGKEKDDAPGTDVVYNHIVAVPERAAFEIRMPVVESYTYDLRGSGITCDVDQLEGLVVNHEPSTVYVAAVRGYQDQGGPLVLDDATRQDRTRFYEQVRFQQVLFWLTQQIVDDLVQGAEGEGVDRLRKTKLARHQVFPDVLRIVQQYIDRRVTFGLTPGGAPVDRRELALEKYAQLLRERVREGILPAAATTEAPLVPIVNSFRPYNSTKDVNYRTARPVVALTRSHLNYAGVPPEAGGWEREAIEILEDLDIVECYTPNDRTIGLVVPYEYSEQPHHYIPDFVVRLQGGKLIMLEIKGGAGEHWNEDKVLAKNAAAKKWVAAVNNAKRFGQWDFEICRDLAKLRGTLQRHANDAEAKVLPFRQVTPTRAERFKSCVPLTSLRAAAGRWSEEQGSLDGDLSWATEWVTFETRTRFGAGMFLARVQGDSMEPDIPNGSYCLFRPVGGGSRQGRRLLVWNRGLDDPATGGHYTLKVYTSEKVADEDGGWHHSRIVLKPLNPAYEPIVLTPDSEEDVVAIAEFVEVVG
jgi:type III restriction enzyme